MRAAGCVDDENPHARAGAEEFLRVINTAGEKYIFSS